MHTESVRKEAMYWTFKIKSYFSVRLFKFLFVFRYIVLELERKILAKSTRYKFIIKYLFETVYTAQKIITSIFFQTSASSIV